MADAVDSLHSAAAAEPAARAPPATTRKVAEYARMEAALARFFETYAVDTVGRMATVSSFLRLHFPHNFFAGFYTLRRDGRTLQIGPYTGNGSVLACGVIEFGKGQCGACVEQRATQIAHDVRLVANYIACDEDSLSEIVVPVFARNRHDEPDAGAGEGGERKLIGVLDLDADIVGAYDEEDRVALERILNRFFP